MARPLDLAFEIDVAHCPNCGRAQKTVAAIEDQTVIAKTPRMVAGA